MITLSVVRPSIPLNNCSETRGGWGGGAIFFKFLLGPSVNGGFKFEQIVSMFDGTWWKCRTGPDDVSCTRMTTLSFFLLVLSPFVIFDSDNPLISCPL